MYCIERSVNTSIARITSDDISTHANFQIDGYHAMVADFCSLVILIHNTLLGEIRSIVQELQGILYLFSPVGSDILYLTLGAHAQEGYGSWVCVCVCVCVCLCVCLLSHISPLEHLFVLKILSRTQRAMEVKKFVEFSLKPLRSRVMA